MNKLLLLALALVAGGCEILENDLSEKQVRVLGPADRAAVTAGEVLFRWEALEHAAGYEFTLVAPSFEAAQRVVADTVIYADSLARHCGCRLTLGEGRYAWSVRGFNGGYASRPENRTLTVFPAAEPGQPDTPGPTERAERPGSRETAGTFAR